MATPSSTPRAPHQASKPTPRSTGTTTASNAAHTPTPASVTSPPTPAAVRAAASPMYLREKLAKSSPLGPGGVSMSRVPTSASEAGTHISIGVLEGLVEKTGLTPAGMGLGDLGIVGAGPNGVNGLAAGLGIGMGVRDQEEERRSKTEAIVSLLGARWGRVCPEGVERAAKRVGLECLWEEGRGGAKRTLSIAGNDVLVDVEFIGEEVQGVTLELAASGQEVGKRAPEGAEVLKKDLTGEDEGYVFLDAFVGNLEKLARMDKLAEGGISCFDAVEGVRAALERVSEWELGRRRLEMGTNVDNVMLERQVLRQGSGRPKIHTRGRVGLAVQYWIDRSLLPLEGLEPGAMDIDTDGADSEAGLKVYAAVLECEASAFSLYPPVRVSNSWIPDSVGEATAPDQNQVDLQHSSIDWQEPSPTLLKTTSNGSINLDDQGSLLQDRTPNVRFVARFEPPVVVPLQIAIDIHQSVGAPLSQEAMQSTTYESLLFADTAAPPNPQEQRTTTKIVTSFGSSGNPVEHRHKYTLFPTQSDYGRVLDSLPFSHPRQIIEILPILRQWVLIGSLLRRAFVPDAVPESPRKVDDDAAFEMDFQLDESMTVEEELAALLASPSSPAAEEGISGVEETALPIDIILTTSSSTPGIGVVWPHGEKLKTVDFGFGLNGTIEVYGDLAGKGSEREKTKRILEVAEDLGVLVAWMIKGL